MRYVEFELNEIFGGNNCLLYNACDGICVFEYPKGGDNLGGAFYRFNDNGDMELLVLRKPNSQLKNATEISSKGANCSSLSDQLSVYALNRDFEDHSTPTSDPPGFWSPYQGEAEEVGFRPGFGLAFYPKPIIEFFCNGAGLKSHRVVGLRFLESFTVFPWNVTSLDNVRVTEMQQFMRSNWYKKEVRVKDDEPHKKYLTFVLQPLLKEEATGLEEELLPPLIQEAKMMNNSFISAGSFPESEDLAVAYYTGISCPPTWKPVLLNAEGRVVQGDASILINNHLPLYFGPAAKWMKVS